MKTLICLVVCCLAVAHGYPGQYGYAPKKHIPMPKKIIPVVPVAKVQYLPVKPIIPIRVKPVIPVVHKPVIPFIPKPVYPIYKGKLLNKVNRYTFRGRNSVILYHIFQGIRRGFPLFRMITNN